jgi:Putative zincin peptidase
MRPLDTLPEEYSLYRTLDLSTSTRALLGLNLVGVVLFFLFGWLFSYLAIRIRPDAVSIFPVIEISGLLSILWLVLALLALQAIMIVLHEGFHGIFFYIFSQARPHFAFKGLYAYASLPGWYFPRAQYLVVCLAPLLGITLLGFLMMVVVPPFWIPPILVVMTLNAAGAVGDLTVALWLVRAPVGCLANDQGDAFNLYIPA